jgi:hypothetical protein
VVNLLIVLDINIALHMTTLNRKVKKIIIDNYLKGCMFTQNTGCNHPFDGFVDRLQNLCFSSPCYPSYRASDFFSSRTTSR